MEAKKILEIVEIPPGIYEINICCLKCIFRPFCKFSSRMKDTIREELPVEWLVHGITFCAYFKEE